MPNVEDTTQASPVPSLEQAKALLETGEFPQAIESLEELIDSLPPPAILQQAYLLQAQALQHDNQIPDALAVLQQLLEEFPFSPVTNPARILLAELSIETKDYTQALSQLYIALDYATDQESRQNVLQLIRQAELENGNPLGAVKALLNEMMVVDPSERLELETIDPIFHFATIGRRCPSKNLLMAIPLVIQEISPPSD